MTKPLLLIVDDEYEMAEFVGETAESVGFDILIATSGKEFQNYYSQNHLSGIVMDIVMPDMDGFELVQWLSANQCRVPIILMSGHGVLYTRMASQIGIANECQMVGILTKPFFRDELKFLFQKILKID